MILEQSIDLHLDHIKRDVVHPAVDHDIRAVFGGLHKDIVHRLDGCQILLGNSFHVPAALFHVTDHSPEDPLISVRVYIDLDIHQVLQARVIEHQDPFDKNDLCRIDLNRLVSPVVYRIVIDRTLNRFTVLEFLQMLYQEICLKRIRMVIVNQFSLFKRNIIVRLVIIVVIDHRHAIPECFLEPVCKS